MSYASGSGGLRSEKLAELIAREIVDEVFRDGFKPGTRLPPERQMVERFQVGRATLREALRILEIHGLLTIKAGPTGGPYVREMTALNLARIASLHYKAAGATVGHVWEARAILEPMMARRVVETNDSAVTDKLIQLREQALELDLTDESAYLTLAGDFHRVIASGSGNPIIDLVSRSLGEVTTFLVTGAVFPLEARRQVMHDHDDITTAILAGEADRVQELMARHMQEMVAAQTGRNFEALGASVPYIL